VKLRCAPCTIHAPAISRDPLHFALVELSLTRRGQTLSGELQIDQLALRFKGELTESALDWRLRAR